MKRSARLEVDLDAISHNYRLARSMLAAGPRAADGKPPRLAAVLKGNAYGLGAVAVADELLAAGVDLLALATLPEALELRAFYPDAPLLVMGHTPTEYLADAAAARLRIALFDLEQAEALSRAALDLGTRALVHIKVDTGMNRLGLKPDAGSAALLARIKALPGIELEGAFTHLALRDRGSDLAQFARFERFLADARESGVAFPIRHVCDGIGFARYPEFRLDLVRVGALLYGVKPLRDPLAGEPATPFALRARISRIRRIPEGEGVGYDESWRAPPGGRLIATLPIGYADGFPRRLGNRAWALLRGRRVPVVGLVMMDQLNLDVEGLPEAAEGDEVLLLGRSGGEELGVGEFADWAGTNRNEVLSALGRRLPRLYHRGGRLAGEADYLLDPARHPLGASRHPLGAARHPLEAARGGPGGPAKGGSNG